MKRNCIALVSCLLIVIAHSGLADIAIVVDSDSEVTSLSRNEAINIFMGRYRKLPGGGTAIPVDLVPVKECFYQALVEQSLPEINAYWARLIFSGQASPPMQLDAFGELTDLMQHNRGAISYMDSEAVSDDVRVLLTLSESD